MPISIQAHAHDAGQPFTHHWSRGVGAGRANEGLRADWQRQLELVVRECGFKTLRFHGLFHDDMFVYREENGQPIYNFQYLDELFDRLLEIGIRPFVELGFCPRDMAREVETVFWWKGHGSPPKNLEKWGELVRRTVSHWVERYGLEEVRTWNFEVWNEPNLHPFFRGTKSEYFELYRASALALKSVDAQLRVGGPSTSNFVPDTRFDGETEDVSAHHDTLRAPDLDALDWRPVWVEQFLSWCYKENLPVDFISCHPYPTDWALDAHGQGAKLTRGKNATPRDLRLLREIVAQSAFPGAEIHLTEWSSSSSPRDFTHDYLQAATFVTRANLESIGTVDSLCYWVFTDIFEEGGAGDTLFHGGFGMINAQGIVKPTFHAYRFLNALGDEMLAKNEGYALTRDSKTGQLTGLCYHYPPEMPLSVPASFDSREIAEQTLALGQNETLQIEIAGLKAGARFELERLSTAHGDAMTAWKHLGCPENPDREQTATLREMARATQVETVEADANGTLIWNGELEAWSLFLVRQI